jgi:hypothetical protein
MRRQLFDGFLIHFIQMKTKKKKCNNISFKEIIKYTCFPFIHLLLIHFCYSVIKEKEEEKKTEYENVQNVNMSKVCN